MYSLLSSTLLGTAAMSNFRILSKEPDDDLFLMRPVNWFLKTDALKIPNLIHSSTVNTFPYITLVNAIILQLLKE